MSYSRGPQEKRKDYPVPTKLQSSDEFRAPGQSRDQRRVEELLEEMAERHGKSQGLTRRGFLGSASGFAAAFIAMNMVFGKAFMVDDAEARDPMAAEERRRALAGQFIFDDQVHYVHENYTNQGLLRLREYTAEHSNPSIKGEDTTFAKIKFQNFLKEVYLQSDTTLALLSGAPSDKEKFWFLPNDQMVEARRIVNGLAGSNRLMAQSIITPGQPGWLEEIDRCVEELKPDSWKGYTVGDPQFDSEYPYRLDDEKLMYPAYEKFVKSGIINLCIHKGLIPEDYEKSYPNWEYGKVDDLPKAAKDWPQLNFIIYHSAIKPGNFVYKSHLEDVRDTGRIDWVTDLAEIPAKHGVTNVYGDLGTVFGASAVTHPWHAAMILGELIKGLGADHVVWGTDSVWHGSPQWQIEAFRRMEIPDEVSEKYGFEKLGPANGPVKNAILGLNSARLYGLDPDKILEETQRDKISRIKRNRDPLKA